RRVISASRAARSPAWSSPSMTQGPAMRTNGRSPPNATWPTCTGITMLIIRGRVRWVGLTRPSGDGFRGALRSVRGLVLVGCVDESREERVGVSRLRFELRVELNRKVPGMPRQLGNLDE